MSDQESEHTSPASPVNYEAIEGSTSAGDAEFTTNDAKPEQAFTGVQTMLCGKCFNRLHQATRLLVTSV